MSDELDDFLSAYDTHRVRDQVGFYESRAAEYAASAKQTSWASEICFFAAAACGISAAIWVDQAVWLGVLAAGMAATGAGITSWADVAGFTANAELYSAARGGLGRVRPDRPRSGDVPSADVQRYVTDVEDILMGEVRTWSEKWGRAADDTQDPAT